MLVSNKHDDEDTTSDDENLPLQFKPHQPRFMTPLCHVTTSSSCDDLLGIQTPTIKDQNLKALVDSGATKNFCSDNYVREKTLSTYSLTNPFVFDSPTATLLWQSMVFI